MREIRIAKLWYDILLMKKGEVYNDNIIYTLLNKSFN